MNRDGRMKVEVINTGTEILLGQITNTHLAFLAQELFPIGLRIERQVSVPDGDAIRDALVETFGRADIVLVTGGLGPTSDDLTRDIAAEVLGLELQQDAEVLRRIEARFARRGLQMTDNVRRQAQVPRGATVLHNAHGTAPGLYLPAQLGRKSADPRVALILGERGSARVSGDEAQQELHPPAALQERQSPHLFLLPGPPRELQPMFLELALPILRSLAPQVHGTMCRTYHVVGVGESAVEALVGKELEAITGMELGYCARPGAVDVRCIGTLETLNLAESIIFSRLGVQVVSEGSRSFEQVIVERLIERCETLAIAESCTGGYVAHRVTNVPGASKVLVEGFVTYQEETKTHELGVSAEVIQTHGAVSAEVAALMAEGARKAAEAVAKTDYAIATTGFAGPDGGSESVPVGTVFVALASSSGPTQIERHTFPTDRETFKLLASQAALDLLRRTLETLEPNRSV